MDDILAVVDEKEAEILKQSLEERFGSVQFEIGERLSYLGIQIDIIDEGTMIDMSFYVSQVLEGAQATIKQSPGMKTTFTVTEDSRKFTEKERKLFHSKVAKLPYLAKRARPDLLTVVSFLCTRVQVATEEDYQKMDRVLGYLKVLKIRY